MNTQLQTALRRKAIEHEGYKQKAYLDIYGNITVGIGHNLSANDVSKDIIEKWFNDDAEYHYQNLLNTFDWFKSLDMARQVILIYMSFNLGWAKFLEFKKMLFCLSHYDFIGAAKEIKDSNYADELPSATSDIMNTLITGILT